MTNRLNWKDEDEDGKLGIIELATMFAKHRRQMGLTKPDQAKVNRLVQQVDANGDHRISKDELVTPTGLDFKTQYAQYDGNSDGEITVLEIERAVASSRREKGYEEQDFQKAVMMLRRHDENRSTFTEQT